MEKLSSRKGVVGAAGLEPALIAETDFESPPALLFSLDMPLRETADIPGTGRESCEDDMSEWMWIPGQNGGVDDDLMEKWLSVLLDRIEASSITGPQLRATVGKLVEHLSAGKDYVARHVEPLPIQPVALKDAGEITDSELSGFDLGPDATP